MNDLQRAILLGLFVFAVALVANAVMVAFGVASPILGSAEQDAIVWIKGLVAGLIDATRP